MDFKIPFTNQTIRILQNNKKTPEAVRRGLAFGQNLGRTSGEKFSKNIDLRTFFSLYRMQSDLAACVDILQTNVGLSGYEFISTDNEKEINGQLNEKVNSILNYEEPFEVLKNKMIRDYALAGNGYAVFVKNLDGSSVLGLQNIDPRTMSIVMNSNGQIITYVQKVFGQEAAIFKPEEVIHFKMESDPNNEVFGFPRLTPAVMEILTDIEARNLNMAFFQNDARPSTIYVLDDGMRPTDQENAMKAIRSLFSGGSNKKKSVALSGVKEIKTIGATQTEMEFLEQRKLSTEKICAALRVPKFMLGYTDAVNNNNGTELAKNFVRKTIEPIETAFELTLNKALKSAIDGYEDIEFRFKDQILESANELENRAIALKNSGIFTTKEAKKFLSHEIDKEMEQQDNFDKFIISGGQSAALLEEIGVDPILDPNDSEKANNFIKSLEKLTHESN